MALDNESLSRATGRGFRLRSTHWLTGCLMRQNAEYNRVLSAVEAQIRTNTTRLINLQSKKRLLPPEGNNLDFDYIELLDKNIPLNVTYISACISRRILVRLALAA